MPLDRLLLPGTSPRCSDDGDGLAATVAGDAGAGSQLPRLADEAELANPDLPLAGTPVNGRSGLIADGRNV